MAKKKKKKPQGTRVWHVLTVLFGLLVLVMVVVTSKEVALKQATKEESAAKETEVLSLRERLAMQEEKIAQLQAPEPEQPEWLNYTLSFHGEDVTFTYPSTFGKICSHDAIGEFAQSVYLMMCEGSDVQRAEYWFDAGVVSFTMRNADGSKTLYGVFGEEIVKLGNAEREQAIVLNSVSADEEVVSVLLSDDVETCQRSMFNPKTGESVYNKLDVTCRDGVFFTDEHVVVCSEDNKIHVGDRATGQKFSTIYLGGVDTTCLGVHENKVVFMDDKRTELAQAEAENQEIPIWGIDLETQEETQVGVTAAR